MEKGVSLKLKSKRGTETRDQDEAYLKIKGETVADVEEQAEDAVDVMEAAMEKQRQIDPERTDSSDDEDDN